MKNDKLIIFILATLLLVAVAVIVLQNISIPKEIKPNHLVEETAGVTPEEGTPPSEKEDGVDETSVSDLIIGEWQSLSDPQSVIAFYANGEVEDIYGGGAVSESGTYYIFESPSALPSEVAESLPGLESDAAYLRQTFGSADYYYAIIGLDTDSLSLIYLARGNTLEYRRLTTE